MSKDKQNNYFFEVHKSEFINREKQIQKIWRIKISLLKNPKLRLQSVVWIDDDVR